MVYEFNKIKPVIHRSAFIHPLAAVTGNVIIGKKVYVGPGAAIRGDWGKIVIKDGCNVQENCTIHMFPGLLVTLNIGAHIGHGAIIHGATIGKDVLIGMNSVIMDHAKIGDGSIVGALCLVPEGMIIPRKKIVVGNPARIVKDVSADMFKWKKQGTLLYQNLPAQMIESWNECEPLKSASRQKQIHTSTYRTWKKTER